MCWGRNNYKQLGNGSSASATPVAVIGLQSVKSISAGHSHTCAVLDNGSAMCWGRNNSGQLGNGSSLPGNDNATPVAVIGLQSVKSISAGGVNNGSHTCDILDNGSAMCWGSNSNGQLGNGSSGTNNSTPGNVINLSTIRLHGISQSLTNVDNETAPNARSGETLSAGG